MYLCFRGQLAKTILDAATPRQKMQIKLAISINFKCCHPEIEDADHICHLNQSEYTATVSTSPNTDPIPSRTWQGSHGSTPVMTQPAKEESILCVSCCQGRPHTTRPPRHYTHLTSGLNSELDSHTRSISCKSQLFG